MTVTEFSMIQHIKFIPGVTKESFRAGRTHSRTMANKTHKKYATERLSQLNPPVRTAETVRFQPALINDLIGTGWSVTHNTVCTGLRHVQVQQIHYMRQHEIVSLRRTLGIGLTKQLNVQDGICHSVSKSPTKCQSEQFSSGEYRDYGQKPEVHTP